MANLNGLTQVANRPCFDGRLQGKWKRLAPEQQPLPLILYLTTMFRAKLMNSDI
ncbi:MAG: hypothetical protein V7K97_09100 [Nostoc sp.]|uniref:hypothetical protein n=1 Tax=Nostoc sp. TaxID=1180 RepID=UPI002FF9CF2E